MEKEGEIMTRVMEKINNIEIPTNVEREIGLSKDWKKKISPEDVKKIVNNAFKFKDALRKLSKN